MPLQTKIKNGQLLTPVTNGDAHDHLGGDGGTIALSSLSGNSDNVTEGATNKYISAPNLRATIITPAGDTAPTDGDIFAFSQTVGGNLKKSLFSTLKTFLRANFDTVYAAIANGVTNGDSHNHVGGDGASLTYTGVVGTFLNNVVVALSTTWYSCPMKPTADTVQNQYPWPEAGTLSNMNFRISTSQPASGSLVITLLVNGTPSALTITIPAGSASATYSDNTHTVVIAANDLLQWTIQNNATASSAGLTAVNMKITKNTA